MHHALPVFVDTDPETFQIDARQIEAAITERTRCIMPVHLGGSAADMDAILAIAAKHKIPVVEDACQAALAEWRGKKVSTLGDLGCFSFQASKNLNSGEGGAILTNERRAVRAVPELSRTTAGGRRRRLFVRPQRRQPADDRVPGGPPVAAAHAARGAIAPPRAKRRLPHRAACARSPASRPRRMYDGCTRNAYHLYMFRYDTAQFAGLPRRKFIEALQAEGIPAPAAISRSIASRS